MGIFNFKKKTASNGSSLKNTQGLNRKDMQKKYYNLQDITVMSLGANCCIAPVDAGYLFEGDMPSMLATLGNSPRLKEFLPNMDFSTEEAAYKFLENEVVRTESGLGFSYFVMMGCGPLGMIMVNTPELNEKSVNFPHWTLDFFLFEIFESKGFMSAALPRVLYTLKEKIHVDKVYAFVDPENTRCLKLLSSLSFDEIASHSLKNPQNPYSKPRLFCCDLASLSFQRR